MGTLHLVATPIGNLDDVTLRALRTLREADLLLAEDTRHTRILLEHHDIAKRSISLNAHNERSRVKRVLQALDAEESVALVSDAGTPLVSDPGARLVAAVVDAGHAVDPIPGPSAVMAALQISGLAPEPFCFLGFLPRKSGARRRLLETYRGRPETLIVFESPRRVGKTLADLSQILGERRGCVARELTKIHQEAARGSLAELALRYSDGARGECTLVIEGAAGPEVPSLEDVEVEIRERVAKGERPKEIASELAIRTGRPKRELYARAVAVKENA